jgi:hypothetical protein
MPSPKPNVQYLPIDEIQPSPDTPAPPSTAVWATSPS